jgi:hypothetical protein
MGQRSPIPTKVIAEVTTASRRRCCICFGLEHDDRKKQGQIAHLDRDPSNHRLENLAFLCLDHHDQYDSRTSQSKGFTIDEVKRYRLELVSAMSRRVRPSEDEEALARVISRPRKEPTFISRIGTASAPPLIALSLQWVLMTFITSAMSMGFGTFFGALGPLWVFPLSKSVLHFTAHRRGPVRLVAGIVGGIVGSSIAILVFGWRPREGFVAGAYLVIVSAEYLLDSEREVNVLGALLMTFAAMVGLRVFEYFSFYLDPPDEAFPLTAASIVIWSLIAIEFQLIRRIKRRR